MDYYLRIGEIPPNEKSKIYQWDPTHTSRIAVGEEKGVSAYRLAYSSIQGWGLDLNDIRHSSTGADTIIELVKAVNTNEKRIYLITGDEVGLGLDNEPVLRNVQVICEVPKGQLKTVLERLAPYGN